MDPKAESTIKDADDRLVPEELLKNLHAATERFHELKRKLEASMGVADFDHQQHVSAAADELRAAEQAMEQASEAIRRNFNPKPPA